MEKSIGRELLGWNVMTCMNKAECGHQYLKPLWILILILMLPSIVEAWVAPHGPDRDMEVLSHQINWD